MFIGKVYFQVICVYINTGIYIYIYMCVIAHVNVYLNSGNFC